MKTLANIQELARALRNMIRPGIIVETDLNAGRCRVQTGGMCTDWLQWLTHRAGRSRTWWAPSVGEQVLILAVGGELDTAFVLPGIYSGDNPAPSASADALHIRFPDGAVIEYEPETSALTVSGIKTASVTASDSVTATVPVVMVKASTRITLDTPEVVCTNRLITARWKCRRAGRCAATLNTPAVNSHQTVRYCIPINTPATVAAQQGDLYDSALSRNESQ